MSNTKFFEFGDLSVIDISGADAAAIVNNITTNEVLSLAASIGRETFVTDVRGKTLGHVVLIKQSDGVRLIGAPGQSEAIAAHIDRYTIREDAKPTIRDAEMTALVLSAEAAKLAGLGSETTEPIADVGTSARKFDVYRTRMLGEGTSVLLAEQSIADELKRTWTQLPLSEGSLVPLSEGSLAEFHQCRVQAGFPWHGVDLDDSNLPQELDRDAEAISFTKGCYLGQETVARLDALGQVQRKLVRWRIEGSIPAKGAILEDGEKKVGRLTSIAQLPSGDIVALGFARRSHFESGAVAKGSLSDGKSEFFATVV